MTARRSLLRCRVGAGAVEFALILPLLLLLLFGIIDAGRWLWTYNQAENATQMGARMAIVTNVLSPGLIDEDYAGQEYSGVELKPGDLVPSDALGEILCNSSGCSCQSQPCPATLGTMDQVTFDAIVTRMNAINPSITAANVEVSYSGSGLGSAGAIPVTGGGTVAESIEISPFVTVGLRDMTFKPITGLMLAEFPLPDFRTTMTAEDVSGVFSE